MSNFNKVILMGRLTRDPQMSYLPSQTAITEFGVAINRKWTSQDGTSKDDTTFVDCKVFGKQAETINQYFSKGEHIFFEGRIAQDSWVAQDGSKRSKTYVIVERFQFLPKVGKAAEPRPQAQQHQQSKVQQSLDNEEIPF